jgi:hypothetical protein
MAKNFPRTTINFWLDSLLLLLFLIQNWVTVVLRFIFPPGPDAAGWSLWGWNYDQWCGLQFAALCTMGLAILIHVMLHWTWVCGVLAGWLGEKKGASRDDGSRTLWGVGLLIVILNLIGLAVAAAALMVEAPAK